MGIGTRDIDGSRKKISELDIDRAINMITERNNDPSLDRSFDRISDRQSDDDAAIGEQNLDKEVDTEQNIERDLFVESHVERSEPSAKVDTSNVTEHVDYNVVNKKIDVYSGGLQDISDNELSGKEEEEAEELKRIKEAEAVAGVDIPEKFLDDNDELLGTALAELEQEEKEKEAEEALKKKKKKKKKKKVKKKKKKKAKMKTKNKDKDKDKETDKKDKDTPKEEKKKEKKKKKKLKDKDKTTDGTEKE